MCDQVKKEFDPEWLGAGLKYIYDEAQRYGTAMYKGVLIVWDEDRDDRVFQAVDVLKKDAAVNDWLHAVYEHEGGLTLVLDSYIEHKVTCPADIDIVNEPGKPEGGMDVWCVDAIHWQGTFPIEAFTAAGCESYPEEYSHKPMPADKLAFVDGMMGSMGLTRVKDRGYTADGRYIAVGEAPQVMANYVGDAMARLSGDNDWRDCPHELMHSVMGVVTEAGELMDVLKRYSVYGKEFDKVNLKEEYGDLLWYIALGCKYLDISMSAMMDANIRKLAKRYPDKFTKRDALSRDLGSERAELEAEHGCGPDCCKRQIQAAPWLQELADGSYTCKIHGGSHMLDGSCHGTHVRPDLGTPPADGGEPELERLRRLSGQGAPSMDSQRPRRKDEHWCLGLAQQADLDQFIYHTAKDLCLAVEKIVNDANTSKEEKHRHLMLINALDAYCETEGGEYSG